MAPKRNKIDLEWALSLVGLPVKIPDNWWVGYTGSYLHDGKIVAFDVVNQKWLIELDDQDDDDQYLASSAQIWHLFGTGPSSTRQVKKCVKKIKILGPHFSRGKNIFA